MDDTTALLVAGTHEFTKRVHAVTEDQWELPTPDSEWSVADLVGHLIDEHLWMPPLLHGLDLETAGEVVAGARSSEVHGGVGSNLITDWDNASTASIDALTAEGVMDRKVALSRGETPASAYLAEMLFDVTVHAWDLGTAIGHPEPLPDDLVAHVHAMVLAFGDLSGTGMFAPAVTVDDDAPLIDRLVALTGRNPR